VTRVERLSPYLLAGLLVGAGVTHFVKPGFYDPMVPDLLPGTARAWTYGSGVLELAVGAAVAAPTTRRWAALSAAVLFVAVFPANIKMALDADTSGEKIATYARLPLQVPLVLWAWRLHRHTGAKR
jgi:uncharacterized membrane protein